MTWPPRLCPKCNLRPPRRLHSKHGKVPFCHGCHIEARREHNRVSNLKRPNRQRRALTRTRDDIPAAEIERLFAAALKVEKAKTREPY